MKTNKYILAFIIVFCVLLGRAENTFSESVEISASGAILMIAETGEIIYEKNSDEKHKPASTTKIITAITALGNSDINDSVAISYNAQSKEGSSCYLKAEEKIKMSDLICGLMLNSGNDAATAIAEHISGNENEFARLMTATAKKVGAENSSFSNASGLDDEAHFSTPKDLALITAYALNNDIFREIVSRKTYTCEYSAGYLTFTNHNKLLKQYEGCIGVKTGYTKKSGRCLVSAAEKNGATLICVTMNDPNDWADHKKLLDIGFEKIKELKLINKNEELRKIKYKNDCISAVAKECVLVPCANYSKSDFEVVTHTIQEIKEPVEMGEKIGYAEIFCKNKLITKIDLIAEY